MEIFDFDDKDRGRYTALCLGTDVVTSAVIDVAVPAKVEVVEDEIIAKANTMIELCVNVTGMPKPEITWSKVCFFLLLWLVNIEFICFSVGEIVLITYFSHQVRLAMRPAKEPFGL